jgi:glycosyltransferase involved in cell wall biosynthesis
VLQGKRGAARGGYETKVVKVRLLWKLRSGKGMIGQLLSYPYLFSLNLSFTLRCIPHLVRFKPDIVLPGNGGIQNLIVRIASWLFGWKHVIVGHAGMGAPDKWNMLTRPDYYIYPSKRNLNWAKGLAYSNGLKMTDITHGVDIKRFSKGRGMSIPLEKPIVLCVSSLDPYKRVDLAVRAVSKMKKGSLLLIGGDGGGSRVDDLAKRLLGKKRYLRIKVSPTEMPKYYSSSDVFTLPSDRFEAFGIANLEAMASGLPIVATDDKLRREILGDAGIFVDPSDISEYAHALEKAASSELGKKTLERAKLFSWDKIVRKYEDVFEELLK